MRALRLIAAALAALTLAVSSAGADQLLGTPRIDNSNRVQLPGGPTLGRWVGQKYIATPDAVQIQGSGSSGDVSGTCVTIDGGKICRSQSQRGTDGQINLVDLGAKCDGVNDDSKAILDATNLAAGLGGRDVLFPAGQCLLKNYLLPPSRTRWVSRGGTIIKFFPTMPVGGALKGAISFENVSDIFIDGITFQGNGTSTPACGTGCPGTPRITAVNASNVTIRNTTIRDFGNLNTDANGKMLAYAQGIVAFSGSNWVIDRSRFINNSGDGIAWSNGTDKVEVKNSYFEGNNDSSGPVCTIGGKNFSIHDNEIYQRAGNTAPIVVMDRCTQWQIVNNRIYGLPSTGGQQTGQAIRVARYTLENSNNVNRDFIISGNVISGSDTAISVEGAGSVQRGYTDSNTGQVWPAVNVPGGGRFAVTGNTVVGANNCIGIYDSEVGAISANTCTAINNHGLLMNAFFGNTGSIAVGSNTFVGSNVAGSFGVRQVASGGTITPSAIAPQFVSGFTVSQALDPSNAPPVVPVRTRAANDNCTPGEITMKADGTALQACSSFGVVKSAPLQ